MNIFDVVTSGALGSVLDSMTGGAFRAGSQPGGSGGLGGLGAGIGAVLDTLGKTAKSAANTIERTSPGGLGGLAGAGALGTLLGGLLKGDMMRSLAMAGAGAVAWNFYKKWAGQQNAQAASASGSQLADTSQAIPGFGDAAPAAPAPGLPARGLDPTATLIMRSLIYAASADGTIDATEQKRIDSILANMLPGENVEGAISAIRKEGIDPAKIARSVTSPEQAEDVYRLSCSVIDVDHFMEQSYLQALAKALRIDDGKKRQLEAEADQARQQLNALAAAS